VEKKEKDKTFVIFNEEIVMRFNPKLVPHFLLQKPNIIY